MLIVKDTGPGIPKEEIPKVMQAFGQGSLAHQTAEGGTGLGLPIVQNLVEPARRHVRAALRAAQGHRGRRRAAARAGCCAPCRRCSRWGRSATASRTRLRRSPRAGTGARRAGRSWRESTADHVTQLTAALSAPGRVPTLLQPRAGHVPHTCGFRGELHGIALHQCLRDRRGHRAVRGLRPVARGDRALGGDDGRGAAAYHARPAATDAGRASAAER